MNTLLKHNTWLSLALAAGAWAMVGRATIYNPNTGQATHISGAKGESGGFINVNGQVIAGKDGNYYRPDGQGGWDQITKPPTSGNTRGAGGSGTRQDLGTQNQWSKAQPSAANQQHFQQLNNESSARQIGAQRQQSFQMNRPAFGGGGRRR